MLKLVLIIILLLLIILFKNKIERYTSEEGIKNMLSLYLNTNGVTTVNDLVIKSNIDICGNINGNLKGNLVSPNGNFTLNIDDDGNVIIIDKSNNKRKINTMNYLSSENEDYRLYIDKNGTLKLGKRIAAQSYTEDSPSSDSYEDKHIPGNYTGRLWSGDGQYYTVVHGAGYYGHLRTLNKLHQSNGVITGAANTATDPRNFIYDLVLD
jgi:hypothetical protein